MVELSTFCGVFKAELTSGCGCGSAAAVRARCICRGTYSTPSFFKSAEGDVSWICTPQIPVGQRYCNPQTFQTISGNG